jgi:hypothetical protein
MLPRFSFAAGFLLNTELTHTAAVSYAYRLNRFAPDSLVIGSILENRWDSGTSELTLVLSMICLSQLVPLSVDVGTGRIGNPV